MAWTARETARVDEIHLAVTNTDKMLTVMLAQCKLCTVKVDTHDVDLHGASGNEESLGLLARTAINERDLKHISRKYRRILTGAWTLIVAVVVGTGTFLANVWRKG